MADKEYFLILPLLLYGLAISDLVNAWKSFFNKEKRHIPYVVTSFLLLELSFWNFYKLNHWMTPDVFESYLSYFLVLLPPLIFLLVVSVFTPDSDEKDIKGYFRKNMPIIFSGLAVFTALHILFDTNDMYPRLLGIALLLMVAVFRKEWMIYLLLVFRVGAWFLI
jgi:hypothetical protein